MAPSYQVAFQEAEGHDFKLEIPDPTDCLVCMGTATSFHCDAISSADAKDVEGRILMLPRAGDISELSVVKSYFAQNPKGYGHPCLPFKTSVCGHLVLCGQMTSFGGTGLETKYGTASRDEREKVSWKYVPVLHPTATHRPRNGLGFLTSTHQMDRVSYFNLAGAFWIEKDNLQYLSFTKKQCRLDRPSLGRVKWLYAVAENHRKNTGGDKLDQQIERERSLSPSAAGIANATPAASASPTPRESPALASSNWWSQVTPPPSPPPPPPPHQPAKVLGSRPSAKISRPCDARSWR